MHNPYKTREGGATVTVFAPYDCGNHCPFCINKGEYSDTTGFSEEKIIQSIRTMNEITPDCDFVFTGGEPFSHRDSLQRMLKITCINCSRHLVKYVEESPDELLSKLKVPTRVNCVLYKEYPTERLPEYLERWTKYNIPVQFRFDYTATTPENLYDREGDNILRDLNHIAGYTGLDGCRMRCGFHFNYEGLELTYHKTLPYSTIVETDENGKTWDILYDIIIKQNGEIRSDWDETVLDVEGYRNVVFEPYDLKILEGDLKHTAF